ncbi:MAG: CHAP domain-containing protein [Acetobacteraceae bacterium]|nr:CHAP domain-containing protein [Acetobacteraceae bacterium]
MRVKGTALAFCVLFGAAAANSAGATQPKQHQTRQAGTPAREVVAHNGSGGAVQPGRAAAASRRSNHTRTGGGISCVPYARQVTGMAVSGDGGRWWYNAAGLYARGQQPEPGSVLAFRSSSGMPRGHVAVVRRVLGPRHVLIDHANWGGPGIRRGSVMHDVSVIDVSENNDWTAVRVQSGYNSSVFGRVYATYGFIYNRPEENGGTAYASRTQHRPAQLEQIAEMPAQAVQHQERAAWR